MIIEVKQKHINKGKIGCFSTCPIALAIRDVVKNKDVEVYNESIMISDDGNEPNCYKTTKKVVNFIHKFDNAEKVKPMKFRLVKEMY